MVCGQSFNLNTLPPKIQPCYENSPILWHKADEHVTCTLKSCLMPGMCRGGAGRVSCWQCVHGKTQLWALPCATSHEQYELWAGQILHSTQPESRPRARGSWDAQPRCVLGVGGLVGTRHQLSSSARLSSLLPPHPLGLGNTQQPAGVTSLWSQLLEFHPPPVPF